MEQSSHPDAPYPFPPHAAGTKAPISDIQLIIYPGVRAWNILLTVEYRLALTDGMCHIGGWHELRIWLKTLYCLSTRGAASEECSTGWKPWKRGSKAWTMAAKRGTWASRTLRLFQHIIKHSVHGKQQLQITDNWRSNEKFCYGRDYRKQRVERAAKNLCTDKRRRADFLWRRRDQWKNHRWGGRASNLSNSKNHALLNFCGFIMWIILRSTQSSLSSIYCCIRSNESQSTGDALMTRGNVRICWWKISLVRQSTNSFFVVESWLYSNGCVLLPFAL